MLGYSNVNPMGEGRIYNSQSRNSGPRRSHNQRDSQHANVFELQRPRACEERADERCLPANGSIFPLMSYDFQPPDQDPRLLVTQSDFDFVLPTLNMVPPPATYTQGSADKSRFSSTSTTCSVGQPIDIFENIRRGRKKYDKTMFGTGCSVDETEVTMQPYPSYVSEFELNMMPCMTHLSEATMSTCASASVYELSMSAQPSETTIPSSLFHPPPGLELENPRSVEATTLMVSNLPWKLTQESLAKAVDELGFSGTYDLVYIPRSAKRAASYGFINFIEPYYATRFSAVAARLSLPDQDPGKVVHIEVAKAQGFEGTLAVIGRGGAVGKRVHAPLIVNRDGYGEVASMSRPSASMSSAQEFDRAFVGDFDDHPDGFFA